MTVVLSEVLKEATKACSTGQNRQLQRTLHCKIRLVQRTLRCNRAL